MHWHRRGSYCYQRHCCYREISCLLIDGKVPTDHGFSNGFLEPGAYPKPQLGCLPNGVRLQRSSPVSLSEGQSLDAAQQTQPRASWLMRSTTRLVCYGSVAQSEQGHNAPLCPITLQSSRP